MSIIEASKCKYSEFVLVCHELFYDKQLKIF